MNELSKIIILKSSIQRGLDKYLKETTFGAWSLWYHSSTGINRATTIQSLLDNDKVSCYYKNLQYLLWAILLSRGKTLRTYIQNEIILSGLYASNLVTPIQDDFDIPSKGLSETVNIDDNETVQRILRKTLQSQLEISPPMMVSMYKLVEILDSTTPVTINTSIVELFNLLVKND